MFFLDTNILVYAFSLEDKAKQQMAQTLIKDASTSNRGMISSQVIQEFCNVVLKKAAIPMKPADLLELLQKLLNPLVKHYPSPDFYTRAVFLHQKHSLSFYDALIVQAALDNGCSTLYTEDLGDGYWFGDLVVRNPFVH